MKFSSIVLAATAANAIDSPMVSFKTVDGGPTFSMQASAPKDGKPTEMTFTADVPKGQWLNLSFSSGMDKDTNSVQFSGSAVKAGDSTTGYVTDITQNGFGILPTPKPDQAKYSPRTGTFVSSNNTYTFITGTPLGGANDYLQCDDTEHSFAWAINLNSSDITQVHTSHQPWKFKITKDCVMDGAIALAGSAIVGAAAVAASLM